MRTGSVRSLVYYCFLIMVALAMWPILSEAVTQIASSYGDLSPALISLLDLFPVMYFGLLLTAGLAILITFWREPLPDPSIDRVDPVLWDEPEEVEDLSPGLCSYCHTKNPSDLGLCKYCGAPLGQKEKRGS